jgi:hypothetical protein
LAGVLSAAGFVGFWLRDWWALVVFARLAWGTWWATRPLAVHVDPFGPATLRDAVIYLTDFRACRDGAHRWSHEEISIKVRLMIAETLHVPFEEIKPECRLIEDLGAE